MDKRLISRSREENVQGEPELSHGVRKQGRTPPKITEVCENDPGINLKDHPMAKLGKFSNKTK